MALISKPKTFAASAVIVASEHNDNFDTIYNEFNGSISNANITAAAAIADTKLAQITTANKVDFSALTDTTESAGDVAGYDGSGWSCIAASTSRYRVLMSMGSTSAASFQQINLASASAITGALPVANGGSGTTGDSIVKGWVRFEADGAGATRTITDHYNVSQVLDYGTGFYGVYWDTNFANSSYAVVATAHPKTRQTSAICNFYSVNAGSVAIAVNGANDSALDPVEVNVIALGDQ